MNQNRYTVYKLQFPVEFGETLVTELKIRRPQGKHLRTLPTGEMENLGALADLMASLCGQPPQLIDLLEGEDWREVNKIAQDFLSVMNAPSANISASSPASPSA